MDYLAVVRREGEALAAAARRGLDAPVDHCPGWTVRSVVEHTGLVHCWVTRMVRTRASERLERRELPTPPSEDEALVAWFAEGVDALIDVLSSTPPDEPVWNWSLRPHVAGFWPRRMAHETAVHRWDAERGHGGEQPIPATLAVDTVEEVFDTVAPRLLRGDDAPATLGGTLHLHCTDVEGEWLVSLKDGQLDVRREHAKGDCAVRGTASDVALFLNNRPVHDRLEVFGDRAVAEAWGSVQF